MDYHPYRTRSAFTLLELVLVIAAFAVAIALLVPAFRKITGSGQKKKAEEIFRGQLLANTFGTTITSPSSKDRAAWDPGWWNDVQTANSLFCAVIIDENLLNSAIDYHLHGQSEQAKAQARAELNGRLLHNNRLFFLFFVKPITTGHPNWWKLRIGPLKETAKLVPFEAAHGVGDVIDSETGLDQDLTGSIRPSSALVSFKDTSPNNGPSLTIRISDIRHSIKAKNDSWLISPPQELNLRVETGIRFLRMVEQGLEKEFLARRNSAAFPGVEKKIEEALLSFLVDVAIGYLFK